MAIKQHYTPENHEGKLFRVRNKDHGDGSPTVVWGEHLTHEQAHSLKERVCGRELSRDARIEEMTAPPPQNPVDATGAQLDMTARRLTAPRRVAGSSVVTPGTPPPADPTIAHIQARAMAGARGLASHAQQRHEEHTVRQGLVSIPGGAQLEADPAVAELEVPEDIDGDIDSLIDGDIAAET